MNATLKTALVTGAGSGIGRAAALRLGKKGVTVCVNDLPSREKDALAVVERITGDGGNAFFHAADVTDEEDIRSIVRDIVDRRGGINILVSNAGISGAGASFFDITKEAWERMLSVNLTSHFLVTREVLPHMIEARRGRIVTIASIAGISSLVKANAHYAAAKGGLIAFTKRLARDFGEHNITVNCVAPGFVRDTGFNERMAEEKADAYISQIPLGREGRTDDIAGVIAYLVSDEAGWITGQTIVMDGGATC